MNIEPDVKKQAIIVPHTHFDREWYLPFQKFRFKLVKLIDELLRIVDQQEYYFMLDGQTIVIEDYLEIRPYNKEPLLKNIRKGNFAVGPWYILPDEWLVGQESIIRNLEYALDMANELDIPLMKIGYLPDQFGHTRAIPQIFTAITDIDKAVIWRGVGKEVTETIFKWKSFSKADKELLTIYLPYGYGNAASLPETLDELKEEITRITNELDQWSPAPIYLLMNGSDHLFPQPKIKELVKELTGPEIDIEVSLLDKFIDLITKWLIKSNYEIKTYSGEFRSPLRAHLLQDTYSARIWIKQWNQLAEDLLINYAEPLDVYHSLYFTTTGAQEFIKNAWKWLLRNQPHDSICGCSIDQTHEEMKSRFSWSQSISEAIIDDVMNEIKRSTKESNKDTIIVYNPNNNSKENYFEFEAPSDLSISCLKDSNNNIYPVQPLTSSKEILYETTMKGTILKATLRGLNSRKIFDYYINKILILEGEDGETCEIRLICDKTPVGEIDIIDYKRRIVEIVNSKRYKRFHAVIFRTEQRKYASIAKLTPWSFTEFSVEKKIDLSSTDKEYLEAHKNEVENQYYKIKFNKNGTFDLFDKKTNQLYKELHKWEDWGDRGDEYTFGRLGPEKAIVKKVKRTIISKGKLVTIIKQMVWLKIFAEIDDTRTKRVGEKELIITSYFRFYGLLPRIDIETKLKNTAKDHRLRICFDLPFKSKYTLTSTHFGVVRRKADPMTGGEFKEQPSGIQPQKRFIIVKNEGTDTGFVLMNQGLPEVELVSGNRLALTLIRAIGYLSRSDYPERPEHAGPFLETPGAQELDEYIFNYAIAVIPSKESIPRSYDLSEAFSVKPLACLLQGKVPQVKLEPVIDHNNPWIKISSIRYKKRRILITLFNLSDDTEDTLIKTNSKLTKCNETLLDGSIKEKHLLKDSTLRISFRPGEIKMLSFE